jgi:hypothetical protein
VGIQGARSPVRKKDRTIQHNAAGENKVNHGKNVKIS